MSEKNFETVRRMLNAWGDGDFAEGTRDLDENVVFVVRNDFPEAGVFVGPAGISKYMRRFLENWERYRIETMHLDAVGDTVVAHVRQHGDGRGGVAVEIPSFTLITFRGGRIVRIEWFRHEKEALEAAGLSE